MDIVSQPAELPRLESSCSPENAETYAEPTRWQRLRAVAQTQSLLPADSATKALAVDDGPYALHVASSPLSHFAIDSLLYQDTGILTRPAQIESARARVLLQSQHISGVTDSLDADLQVEAVLRKAANQAACLAGLPRAASRCNKALPGLQLQPCSPTRMPHADSKVPHPFSPFTLWLPAPSLFLQPLHSWIANVLVGCYQACTSRSQAPTEQPSHGSRSPSKQVARSCIDHTWQCPIRQ